jgi:hypothetical protein
MSENDNPGPPEPERPTTEPPASRPAETLPQPPSRSTQHKKPPWYNFRRLRERIPEITLILLLGLTGLTGATARKIYQVEGTTQNVATRQVAMEKKVDTVISSGPSQGDEGQDEKAFLLLKIVGKVKQVISQACTAKEAQTQMYVQAQRLDKAYAALHDSKKQFPHSASDDHPARVALERLKRNARVIMDGLDKSPNKTQPEIRDLRTQIRLIVVDADALIALLQPSEPEAAMLGGRNGFVYVRVTAEGEEESRAWKISEVIDSAGDALEQVIRFCSLLGK